VQQSNETKVLNEPQCTQAQEHSTRVIANNTNQTGAPDATAPDPLAGARRNAKWSYILTCLFFIPLCWLLGLGYAISALFRSRGRVGWLALLVNLGVLVILIMVGLIRNGVR
jgi:hypothetical protein